MAGSVNKAFIIGRLGKDAECHNNGNGKLIVNLSVATSERWKDKASGEQKERTEWHRVSVFQESAAKFAQHLKKGELIHIEGMLQTRKWTDGQGVERYTTEIVVKEFAGTVSGLESHGTGGPPPASSPDDYGTSSSRPQANRSEGNMGVDSDEIPF